MNKRIEKKYIIWAFSYLLAGLCAGVYYREFSKAFGYVNAYTPLGLAHPHLLVLGFIITLLLGFLLAQLPLSLKHKKLAFAHYNAGVILTAVMLIIRGTFDVLAKSSAFVLSSSASTIISVFSGLGHIILAAGLIIYFICFIKAYKTESN